MLRHRSAPTCSAYGKVARSHTFSLSCRKEKLTRSEGKPTQWTSCRCRSTLVSLNVDDFEKEKKYTATVSVRSNTPLSAQCFESATMHSSFMPIHFKFMNHVLLLYVTRYIGTVEKIYLFNWSNMTGCNSAAKGFKLNATHWATIVCHIYYYY